MAVRPRGDSWQADFTVKGERYRETFGTKEDAEAYELEARAAIKRGEKPSRGEGGRSTVPLKELFERVFEDRWKDTKAERSHASNGKIVQAILGENRPVDKIDQSSVDHLVKELKDRGQDGSTINRKLSNLSVMLKYAQDRGWIKDLPRLKRRKEAENRIRWVDKEEEGRIKAWCLLMKESAFLDLVEFLIDTGFRLGEAMKLQWRDVDFEHGYVRAWDTKNGKGRSVPIMGRTVETLKARKEKMNGPQVFHDIGRWAAERKWDAMRTSLGLDHDVQFVLHSLRHTFASRHVQLGTDILVVKELCGHKSLSTTQRYAHLHSRNLVDAIARMHGIINPVASAVPSPVANETPVTYPSLRIAL